MTGLPDGLLDNATRLAEQCDWDPDLFELHLGYLGHDPFVFGPGTTAANVPAMDAERDRIMAAVDTFTADGTKYGEVFRRYFAWIDDGYQKRRAELLASS